MPSTLREGQGGDRADLHGVPPSPIHSHCLLLLPSREMREGSTTEAAKGVSRGRPLLHASQNDAFRQCLCHRALSSSSSHNHRKWFLPPLLRVLCEEWSREQTMRSRVAPTRLSFYREWGKTAVF